MPDLGRPGSLSNRLAATTKLLVVEDEDDISAFLRAYFRASGYDLMCLDPSSPEEIVAAANDLRPDCILLDYGLRGFSGDDAYRMLRSDERFSFMPVIVVTADMTAEATAATRATGIDGFLTKPFNVNTLADMVDERIAAANQLAAVGRDKTLPVMSQRYLDARLADELASARHRGGQPLAFALVQLGDGLDAKTITSAIDVLRERLPAAAVLGRTDQDELAIILPGTAPQDLEPSLESALAQVGGLSGVAGVAGFPEHAHTPAELFMAADAALADAAAAGVRVRLAI